MFTTASDSKYAQALTRVEEAIEAFRKGQMVILTDDQNRENEGDLVFPAEDVSSEKINFMVKEARGLVCLSLSAPYVDRLQLPLMSADRGQNRTELGTAFTVSIEATHGVTTGISAADRARTISVAIDENSKPSDLRVPGHIFPLRAQVGGVLQRTGHTEGSIDLTRLAGKKHAAVICEIMNDDGTMARLPELEAFGKKHKIPLLSIEDLIGYRLAHESLVSELARKKLSQEGNLEAVWFQSDIDRSIHFAIVKGDPLNADFVDVRVHKQNPFSDILNLDSNFINDPTLSSWKIQYAMDILQKSPVAVFVYLANDNSRAILDVLHPSPMDPRVYGIGAQILMKLGVRRMKLHLSSERTLSALSGFGLQIVDTIFMSQETFTHES